MDKPLEDLLKPFDRLPMNLPVIGSLFDFFKKRVPGPVGSSSRRRPAYNALASYPMTLS